jgi:predicted lipoprotein with Yx(FWY)xxD motif
MKIHRIVIAAAAIATLGMAGSALAMSAHSSRASAVVSTKHTSLGTILVTGSGQTLYLDVAGKAGRSVLAIWPPLTTTGAPKASGGAKASMLGTTKDATGTKQVTYDGHPLYTFASAATGTSGEGVDGFYVVSPSGTKIASSTNQTTTTTSGTTTTSSSPGW